LSRLGDLRKGQAYATKRQKKKRGREEEKRKKDEEGWEGRQGIGEEHCSAGEWGGVLSIRGLGRSTVVQGSGAEHCSGV